MLNTATNPIITPSTGQTVTINGRAYRWPSRYQWKQLRNNLGPLGAAEVRGVLVAWFKGHPQDGSAGELEKTALNFLKRANA